MKNLPRAAHPGRRFSAPTPAEVTLGVFLISLAVVWGMVHRGVSVDAIGLVLVFVAAFPATLFVALYATTVRWWTFWIGRALMYSSAGMAGLIDLSLLRRWFGPDYWFRDYAVTGMFLLVAYGGLLTCVALLVDKVPLWLGNRRRHAVGSPADTS